MAAVLEKKDPTGQFGAQVDEQIAQATSRIRAHDLTFGGLVVLALVLVFATAMILLDKTLTLPEWVRQVSLGGFLALLAGVAYFTLLSPFRKRINPLYAAKQVERTIDDAKNSVTGYVDAQERADLNPTVKAALASRAARAAAEADVNRAVDHRSLVYVGGVAVVFLLVLAVLFFVFRPAQFTSLVGRAFVPFSSDPIATRTQLTLVKPDPADATITTGQTISVAVHVGGKVPSAESADRVRLLIRHNPADPNYDELPMIQGNTSRDWESRVPDYMVQNGFWYKVAAGDAVTSEHKVTVRSLPMFTDFSATYEYPKYLRRKTETAHDPVIRGYRGTTVTLVAKTNREARDGRMVIEPGNIVVPGTPVAGKPDSLQFQFKLTETSKYKLTFNAANGEKSADAFASDIRVDSDQAPNVLILKPEEDETTAPANDQITIDGKIGDEFGIDTVTLKMKIVSPTERPLPDAPYIPDPKNAENKSLRRAKDDSWPTDFDYKGSVDLATLTKDAAGLPLQLSADMVIEYWLEATDNCTEPKPNVGVSKPKRVRLTPPQVAEMDKQNLDAQKEARAKEEKQHNDKQQEKFNNENRQPPKGDGAKDQPDPKTDNKGDPKNDGIPKPGDKGMGDPKTDPINPADPKKDPGMGMDPSDPKMPNDPKMTPTDPGMMPPNMNMNPMGGMDPATAPMPSTPDQKNLDKQADDLKKQIEEQNRQGGAAKPNPAPNDEDRANPGEQKPQPKDGMDGMKDMAQPKPDAKQPDPMNPMDKGNDPATTKPEGNLQKPTPNSEVKPEPKNDPKNAPSEKREEPFGAPPATEKPQPKDDQPAPKDPNQKPKQDPKSGSTAKPCDNPNAAGDPNGAPADPKAPKKDPAADAGSKPKPMPENDRGTDKDPGKAAGAPQAEPNKGDPKGGDAKPEKTPQPADSKPKPSEDMMGMMETKPNAGANEPKNPNATGSAETKPDDPKKPPMGGADPVAKGMDKPEPKNDEKGTQNAGANAPKQKFDEKQMKDLENAAKDLNSPDPDKKKDAQQKLDKAVGEQNRKELEKMANDLNSPDEKTKAAAQKKLEEKLKNATAGKEPDKKGAPKFDEKQMKEIADAVKDLDSPDKQKQADAQKKLDEMIGQDQRKELEQLAKDLQSPDKNTREAAQKKLEDMKKEFEKQTKNDQKGKELSKEEIAELAKKAQELNSKDQKTREQAEKDLDEKIGKKNREKIQEEMKKQQPGDPPMDPEQLKKQIEEMAKNMPKDGDPKKDWKQGLGSGTQAEGPMDDDPKNRLKTAELMLEEFEKNRYNKELQEKKGWTQEEYDEFLKGYRKRVADLRNEVEREPKPAVGGAAEPGSPNFTPGGGGKIVGKPGDGAAGTSGATVAPPGFENIKRKFEDATKKKP